MAAPSPHLGREKQWKNQGKTLEKSGKTAEKSGENGGKIREKTVEKIRGKQWENQGKSGRPKAPRESWNKKLIVERGSMGEDFHGKWELVWEPGKSNP